MTVWDSKRGLTQFQIKNPYSDGYGEPPGYENYPLWSPDSKRFLIKMPGVQGEFDLQTGALVCVNPQTHGASTLSMNACEVKWIDGKSVWYSDKIYYELPRKPIVTFHVWRVRS